MPRTLVVGLDSVPARLVLETWRDRLPTLRQLAEQGLAAPLRSTDPPITVPAWASMMTGLDPGTLGLYGFRDRADRSYERRAWASSARVTRPTVWEMAARHGRHAIVVGVPPSYPPRPRERLVQVCDFLAPGTDAQYTWPAELAREIQQELGDYPLDVEDYRAEDKLRIARECLHVTEQHFALARHLMTSRPWDLFVFVEIAPDRLQHALLSHIDPDHPRHIPGSPLGRLALAYFQTLDRRLGELIELAGNDTSVLVVSDHGARPLLGGIRVNEWLRREGYLVLDAEPDELVPFDPRRVDWSRTTAWADGGYVGRVYLNVERREPCGRLPPQHRERMLDELAEGLAAIPAPDGSALATDVARPEDRYPTCRGIPPDLWVYLGGLDWRAVGSLGPGPLWVAGNDTGPDDANHDFEGVVLLRAATVRSPTRPATPVDLLDVAPTLLDELGLPGAQELPGQSLVCPSVARANG
jgi:predicted AlkP superfamily phosphohydrolase/phosphomutase